MKKIFFMILLVLLLPLTLMAQTPEPIITVDGLLAALTPLIIFAVTWVIQKIKPTLMGWNVIWVLVPILSLAASSILVLIDQATSFWSQFLWNLLSVFVAQLIIQLQPAKLAQNKIDKKKLLNK